MTNRAPRPLSPAQVIRLQDALLANADRPLGFALTILDSGHVALAWSLAISAWRSPGSDRITRTASPDRLTGRSTLRQRTVGTPSVEPSRKIEGVYRFLLHEQYSFAAEAADPEANVAALGAIQKRSQRHDKLKHRGFYVDIDRIGHPLEPTGVYDLQTVRAAGCRNNLPDSFLISPPGLDA